MDSIPNLPENSVTLTDDERAKLEQRAKILVDEANEAFNHFLSSIDTLNDRVSTLFQIFLVLISIEVVILPQYLQNVSVFSSYANFFFRSVIFFGIVLFGLLVYLLIPSPFRDISIFEEKRFNILCNLDSYDLLSDFLFQMKESYNYVTPIYRWRIKCFFCALISVILMTICYVVLIVSFTIC